MNRLMTDTSDPLQCVAQTRLMGEWIPRVVSGCEVRQTLTPSFSPHVGRWVGGGVCGGEVGEGGSSRRESHGAIRRSENDIKREEVRTA